MSLINFVEVDRISDHQLIEEKNIIKKTISRAKEGYKSRGMCSFIFSEVFPESYNLGGLHQPFFFDKLKFLFKRYNKVVEEINERELTKKPLKKLKTKSNNIPEALWNDYKPTELDILKGIIYLNIKVKDLEVLWWEEPLEEGQYEVLLKDGYED